MSYKYLTIALLHWLGRQRLWCTIYQKLIGYYYRYIAEFTSRDESVESASKSADAYKIVNFFTNGLELTHPIRLYLMLNFSIFYYLTAKYPSKTRFIAQLALDEARKELHKVKGSIAMIMQG